MYRYLYKSKFSRPMVANWSPHHTFLPCQSRWQLDIWHGKSKEMTMTMTTTTTPEKQDLTRVVQHITHLDTRREIALAEWTSTIPQPHATLLHLPLTHHRNGSS
ncbi:hypothetical protein K439DRAFT_1641038 [Ramaria rubella]|nr:hypothetical protein K439DRAFT_1641038 [Ramaria rubella]